MKVDDGTNKSNEITNFGDQQPPNYSSISSDQTDRVEETFKMSLPSYFMTTKNYRSLNQRANFNMAVGGFGIMAGIALTITLIYNAHTTGNASSLTRIAPQILVLIGTSSMWFFSGLGISQALDSLDKTSKLQVS